MGTARHDPIIREERHAASGGDIPSIVTSCGEAEGVQELDALEHPRHFVRPDVHDLEVLDNGGKVDDDAGLEHLRVAAEQVRERVLADAELAEVVEDGDHVLADAAAQGERVRGEAFVGEAEGLQELDALAHDVDGGGELKAGELARVDAERGEERVDVGAAGQDGQAFHSIDVFYLRPLPGGRSGTRRQYGAVILDLPFLCRLSRTASAAAIGDAAAAASALGPRRVVVHDGSGADLARAGDAGASADVGPRCDPVPVVRRRRPTPHPDGAPPPVPHHGHLAAASAALLLCSRVVSAATSPAAGPPLPPRTVSLHPTHWRRWRCSAAVSS
ncbi:hypothetical protein OsI_32187 [Oryza sativa Indica Group]|uniref:Uncharacterized protein n=1 Tax=Oryza sativa subsp. indica TaxID=39946 RepID=A2Z3I3_ORYSI|nr:hypothetical protein OsI_32187 [Oryza sativa Indica Group]